MDAHFSLTTPRLLLRCLREGDADFIHRLVNEPGWLRFIGDRGVHDLAAARGYIAKGPVPSYDENGFGLFCVETRETGRPVGICGLVKRPSLPGPDLGFAFLEEEGGKGFATESGSAALSHAADELGIRRVLAITSPDNLASVRVLEKLGFREEEARTLEGESDPVRCFAWSAPEEEP